MIIRLICVNCLLMPTSIDDKPYGRIPKNIPCLPKLLSISLTFLVLFGLLAVTGALVSVTGLGSGGSTGAGAGGKPLLSVT